MHHLLRHVVPATAAAALQRPTHERELGRLLLVAWNCTSHSSRAHLHRLHAERAHPSVARQVSITQAPSIARHTLNNQKPTCTAEGFFFGWLLRDGGAALLPPCDRSADPEVAPTADVDATTSHDRCCRVAGGVVWVGVRAKLAVRTVRDPPVSAPLKSKSDSCSPSI